MRGRDRCSCQGVVLCKVSPVVPSNILCIVAVTGLEVRSGVVGRHVPAEGWVKKGRIVRISFSISMVCPIPPGTYTHSQPSTS